jgi:hypothetical protein
MIERPLIPLAPLRDGSLQLSSQELRLLGVAIRTLDGSGRFRTVRIQADNFGKWRVEREIDSGLGHCGARAPLCFRQHCRRLRAEVVPKRLERVLGHLLREHNPIVVPGNGKNWGGIVTVGIVELIEVIHLLAEVVNHVSEMKQKRRPPRIVIFA